MSFTQQSRGSQNPPRWLVSKGKYTEAEQILADVEGTEIEDPYVQTELQEIKYANDYEKEHAVRIRDLLRGRVGENDPCTLRRLLLGMGELLRSSKAERVIQY